MLCVRGHRQLAAFRGSDGVPEAVQMRYDLRRLRKGNDLDERRKQGCGSVPSRPRSRFSVCAAPAYAAAIESGAPARKPIIRGPYIVADVESGRVIEEFDALRPWYPASTTKLMTIYVDLPGRFAPGEISLDSLITLQRRSPPRSRRARWASSPARRMTLDNALKMMMVKSANDIAVAVAEAVGGSVAGFANGMNAEAAAARHDALALRQPERPARRAALIRRARDMALVARALLTEFPQYRDYFKLPAIEIGGKVLKNYNTLLERYPGATGMKTGFICASGYNLVGSAPSAATAS